METNRSISGDLTIASESPDKGEENNPICPAEPPTLEQNPSLAIMDYLQSHYDRLRRVLQDAIQSELRYRLAFRSYTSCNLSISGDSWYWGILKSIHTPSRVEVQLSWEHTNAVHRHNVAQNQSLCYLLYCGRPVTLASIIEQSETCNGSLIKIRSNCLSNMNFLLQAMTEQLHLTKFQFVRLQCPESQMISILDALHTRSQVPLAQELVFLQVNTPPPDIPVGMKRFIETVRRDGIVPVYESLDMGKFLAERWLKPPVTLRAIAPAFDRKVSLFEEELYKERGTRRQRLNKACANPQKLTDDKTFLLCEFFIKAFHKYTKQKILFISPSEELRKTETQLKSMEIPKKDIAVLSPRMGYDPTKFWADSPCSDEDPNLVARHQIDSLRFQCQSKKRAITRAIGIIKDPYRATPELMDYLKHSEGVSRLFHAFSGISIESKLDLELDYPNKNKPQITPLQDWVSGKQPRDLTYTVPSQYLDIWEQPRISRTKHLIEWGSNIRDHYTEKLPLLLEDYDSCQRNLAHKISEHAMRSASALDARIFLCGTQNIPSCLPELSCLEADIVVVQGANEIDEACLLAILPQSTKRLILIKEDQTNLLARIHPRNIEDLVLDSTRQSLWDRLVAGGFPVITTLTKDVDLDDGQRDEEPEVEGAITQLDPLQYSEAWKSLQKMVGLDDVKERVRQLHRHAKMNAQRRSIGQPIRTISLNGILMGPPGTGKTTFATLYGRILRDLGLLPRGDSKHLTAHIHCPYRESKICANLCR